MTGASDMLPGGLAVTSWGWTDDDCRTLYDPMDPADRERRTTHRVWKVRGPAGPLGFLVLPAALDAREALRLASKGLRT